MFGAAEPMFRCSTYAGGLMKMKHSASHKWLLAAAAFFLVVVGAGGYYLFQYDAHTGQYKKDKPRSQNLETDVARDEPHPGDYDDKARSKNLDADIALMWETYSMGATGDPTHGKNPRASTDRAINAASRVFNAVSLTGKSSGEVVELLGDPRTSSDSIYNFPFWPPPEMGHVYRFDSGSYGWQFNVVIEDDVVTSVERHWIH